MRFLDLSKSTKKEIIPGYRAVFVHAEHMTLAHWDVDQDAAMPEHSHPHEQIANILEGRFELTVAGETRVLEPGMVAVIPGGVPHGGKALTDCKLLDVFSPVREDYQ